MKAKFRWESGKESLKSKNLPEDKQYLLTKNVPCQCRIKTVDQEKNVRSEKGFGGNWLIPESDETTKEAAVDMNEEEEKTKAEINAIKNEVVSDDIKDIEDLEADDVDNVFVSIPKSSKHEFCETRTYDISITYDFYYQTPRLWLIGYSEKGEPLTKDQMYEDIMSDYAEKTVTMEQHPHQGIQCISIHPCKHAQLMKHVIDTIKANGGKVAVHQAMFFFLKFISSVIPTIEYDFTIDTELK